MSNKNTAINAVLVRLSISIFPNTRQDRQITDEVKIKKSLGNGAGKWVKCKLPEESLDPIRKFCTGVRQFHYLHTSPWEEGQRLLSAKANAKYNEYMDEANKEFFALVDEFGTQYDNWIEQAKILHASTFEQSDYPSWPACRAMFKLAAEYAPVPKPEHFNAEMKAAYGVGLELLTEKKIADAMSDTWERLLKPVQAMAEKLSDPKAIFRDTLVENIKEVIEVMPELNIVGDKKLADATKSIAESLAALNPETLRDSKVDRKDAAEKAQQIIARFGALGKRKFADADAA